MSKKELLREIKEEVVNLKSSPLYKERIESKSFPVIGEGNHDAKVMFIGEAPGAKEAATGKPFCGSAGKLLTDLLDEIDLKRENVYITNILKDRPPNNRDPFIEEIELYAPFLKRQINVIKPKIIVTLGRFSMDHILKEYNYKGQIETISKMNGKPIDLMLSYGIINVLPLFHPAAVIYNRSKMGDLKKGFLVLKNIM